MEIVEYAHFAVTIPDGPPPMIATDRICKGGSDMTLAFAV